MIRLVVGLGNPGREYEKTRHNVGWMVLDRLSEKLGFSFDREKFKGLYGETRINDQKVIFLKPLTYMNRSGESVSQFVRFFKLKPSQVLLIYDDLDLPLGRVRFREKGSSAGHKGVQSVIEALGIQEFPRVKVGIGRPATKEEVVDYVLSPFKKEELPTVKEAIERAANCVEKLLTEGSSQKTTSKCS